MNSLKMTNSKSRVGNVVLVIVSTILFSTVQSMNNSQADSYYPDAWINSEGEEQGSAGPTYIEEPLLWRDLIESNLATGDVHSQICVNGIFILYGEPNFDTTRPEDVKIFSGMNKCVDSNTIMSVQAGQSYGPIFSNSIVLFKRKNLGGFAFHVDKSTNEMHAKFFETLGSLLIVGKASWTLVTGSGKAHCFKPAPDPRFKFPICAITNTKDNDVEMTIQGVYKGCSGAILEVPDCVEFGGEFLDEFDTAGPTVTDGAEEDLEDKENEEDTPGMKLECGADGDFLELLDMRMNDDLTSTYQWRYPKDKSNNWRTEFIEGLFDLAANVCGGNDPKSFTSYYLKFIREAFIFLIEKHVWSKGKAGPELMSPEYNVNSGILDRCMDPESPHQYVPFHITEYKFNPNGNLTKDEEQLSANGPLDLTMEVVWLISNLAVATCHYRLENKIDVWTDFYPFLSQLLLEPMKDHWSSPGKYPEYYKLLFAGYEYERAYKQIRFCVANAMSYTQLDLFYRPNGVIH